MDANQSVVNQRDGEISLMDLVLVIAKHNRLILKLTAAAAVFSVVYAMSLPNSYTAKAVVMPPQQAPSAANALLGQLGGMAGGALGGRNPSDLYVGMLKSRTVADALIMRFKLKEQLHAKNMDTVRAVLAGSTVISVNKDNSIAIEYTDKNPNVAAEIANGYVQELNSLVNGVAENDAKDRKRFYEKQLGEARNSLAKAELEMKAFQEQNRVFRLGGDGGMVLGASGGIPKAELEYVRLLRDMKYQETLLGLMAQQVTTATIDAAKDTKTVQFMDRALPPEHKSRPRRALIVLFATCFAFFVGVFWAFIREYRERTRQNLELAERFTRLRRYLRQGK